MDRVCADRSTPAQDIDKRRCKDSGADGSHQILQRISAYADLGADGAAVAGAIVIGFGGNIGHGAEYCKQKCRCGNYGYDPSPVCHSAHHLSNFCIRHRRRKESFLIY